MSPLDKQAELIKTLLPNAKKVGFLYNPSEQNSLLLLEKFKGIAKAKGLEPLAKILAKAQLSKEEFEAEAEKYIKDTGDEKTSVESVQEAIQ